MGGAKSLSVLSIVAVKVMVRQCAILGVPFALSSPKMLSVTMVSSMVVLSVLAVEVLLTVAGINMSMVYGGIGGGGRAPSKSPS